MAKACTLSASSRTKQNVLDRIDEVGADQATIFALEQALEPAMSKALDHPF